MPALESHQITIFYTLKKSNQHIQPLNELAKFDSNSLLNASCLTSFETLGASKLNHINTLDYHRFASTLPDLVISIRHMSILKSTVINRPALGVINLHSGLLPAYQGVMATFWALSNKEQVIGTTLHYIENSQIDAGSIVSQSRIRADYQQSYLWNVLCLYNSGCQNILGAIQTLEAGNPLLSEPQSGAAGYYSFPSSDDLAEFDLPLFNSNDNAKQFI